MHRLPSSIVTGTYVLPSVYGPSVPLVGGSVKLTSPIGKRFTAKTDADGGFTFSGLPPSTYQIQFDSPPGYVVDWAPNSGAYWRTSEGIIPANPRELVVSPNACRDASYTGLPNGRISGVATSPRGRLPEPIWIRIWPANRVDAIENYWWARNETGPTGAFQIGPLLPGSYVVGTYLWPADFKERSKDMNYVLNVVPQPWFYPGTTDPRKPTHHGGLCPANLRHPFCCPTSVRQSPAKTHSISHTWYPVRAPSIAKNLHQLWYTRLS